ncbi:MAG TPA: hypothetical protein VGP73_05325, partial [Thermoanaerobaculia bacterium]
AGGGVFVGAALCGRPGVVGAGMSSALFLRYIPSWHHRYSGFRRNRALRYDPDKHHRRSIRLKGYNYSQDGAYFVTVCVQQRECLFGEVESGGVQLSDSGTMIEGWWEELEKKFSTVVLDE